MEAGIAVSEPAELVRVGRKLRGSRAVKLRVGESESVGDAQGFKSGEAECWHVLRLRSSLTASGGRGGELRGSEAVGLRVGEA